MARPASQRKNARRDLRIMELYEGGFKYIQIRDALKHAGYGELSLRRIGQIIRAQLDMLDEQKRSIGERHFPLQLSRLETILRSNVKTLTATCRDCTGQGETQDPDRGPGTMITCKACRGDGLLYSARDRQGASKEYRQTCAEINRMLGLYAPDKIAFTDPAGRSLDFMDELGELDADDLEKQALHYLAARDAATEEIRKVKEELKEDDPLAA